MDNDKQLEDLYFQLLKECDNESVRLPPGMKLFADKIYQFAQIVQQQEIDRLNAENERLNAKAAQMVESWYTAKRIIHENEDAYVPQEVLNMVDKALASTDTTWLNKKLAGALEEAAKWFEEDGCTLLPSSVECAVELRRMAADLKV